VKNAVAQGGGKERITTFYSDRPPLPSISCGVREFLPSGRVLYIGIPTRPARTDPSWGKSHESIIIAPNSAAGGFVA